MRSIPVSKGKADYLNVIEALTNNRFKNRIKISRPGVCVTKFFSQFLFSFRFMQKVLLTNNGKTIEMKA